MANTEIVEILCDIIMVFHLTKLMFMSQEYLEGVLELQPLQESPE